MYGGIRVKVINRDTEEISLESLGINSVAYLKEKTISEIKRYEEQKKLILGGDVYLLKKNEIIITGDSWYISNKYVEENNVEYSIKKSLEYVQKYKTRKGIPIFSLVV